MDRSPLRASLGFAPNSQRFPRGQAVCMQILSNNKGVLQAYLCEKKITHTSSNILYAQFQTSCSPCRSSMDNGNSKMTQHSPRERRKQNPICLHWKTVNSIQPRDNTAETCVSKAVSKQPFSIIFEINDRLDTGPECLHYLYISNLVFHARQPLRLYQGEPYLYHVQVSSRVV